MILRRQRWYRRSAHLDLRIEIRDAGDDLRRMRQWSIGRPIAQSRARAPAVPGRGAAGAKMLSDGSLDAIVRQRDSAPASRTPLDSRLAPSRPAGRPAAATRQVCSHTLDARRRTTAWR